MECYNCGAKLGKGDICQNCGANVKIYKKIIMASNAYYNDALEKAAVRDLSGAIESLRTSLRFYKMNIDARNLLGLVYFETGEVVEALTEWVISKNYQPRDNAASRYLNEIQNNPSRLDTINQTIKKYNQALLYCRQDSRDLAIIQLKKVLSLNPKLVSGHQLLALLYIQEKKYDLAKKSLRNAGKIDANNTTTLRYLKEVNAGLRENNPKKQKNEDLISYQSGNETIIQPRYLKDNSAIGTIINMVIGIAIGAAITCFLIVPGVRREIQNQAKAEVLDANNAVASKNQSISSLEAQIEDLTSQITDAKNEEQSSAPGGGYLIKRLIGLPGDVVECKGAGQPVTINGGAINETSYIRPGVDPSAFPFSVTVTEGRVFVMGDNRANSADSRYHQDDGDRGLVPISDVVGVGIAKYWPLDRLGAIDDHHEVFKDVPDASGSNS